VPPDGKKDAIDKMLEESALIHVRSTSAKAFYDGVKRMYDRCIANSRKTTAAEKHQECCLSKLARYGHSSAGLGGAEGFEKLDQVQIQNIRMMFCANAKFVEYGCYAFSLDSLPIYISHLHYADLLTESGGSYEGYLGMALYGYPFPNIFSSRSDETTMTSLPVEKGEAKSELEKKFHQIYPPSHREETSVPIIDGDVTVIITLPEVH
jgi:hypothetical protein